MSPESAATKQMESAKKLHSNLGTFRNGNWYCDCPGSPEAGFHLVKKRTKNRGKWFWRCKESSDAEDGCAFWLWEEDQERRKAKLAGIQPPNSSTVKTPSSNKRKRGEDCNSPTIRSERQIVIDIKNDYSPTGLLTREDDPEGIYAAPPSPKSAKNTSVSTPYQTRREMAPEPTTPGSSSQTAVASRLRALEIDPFLTPVQLQRETVLTGDTKPSLSEAILGLLKSKNVELDDLTVMRMEHMIGREIKQYEAVISHCEMTIEKWSRKSEEWKDIALQEQTKA